MTLAICQPTLYAIIAGIFSLLLLLIIISVVRAIYNITNSVKPEKTLFVIGLTFHLVSSAALAFFVAWLFGLLLLCVQKQTNKVDSLSLKVIFNVFVASYVLQIHLLHLLWLKRLRYVFKGTVWQIRGCVYHPYMVGILCSFAITVSLAAVYTKAVEPHWLVYGALYALSSTLLCLLLCAFVSKLNALYVTSHNPLVDNSDLEHIVVKSLVLGGSSLFCSWIMTLILCVGSVAPHLPIEVVLVAYALDILTNLECVILSYSYNEGLYYTVLGCIHSRVHSSYATYMTSRVQLDLQRKEQLKLEAQKKLQAEEQLQDEEDEGDSQQSGGAETRSTRVTNTETPDTNATGTLDSHSPEASPEPNEEVVVRQDTDFDDTPQFGSEEMDVTSNTLTKHRKGTDCTATCPASRSNTLLVSGREHRHSKSKSKSRSAADEMEVEYSKSMELAPELSIDARMLVMRQLSVASMVMKTSRDTEVIRPSCIALSGTRLTHDDRELPDLERTSVSAFNKQPTISTKQPSVSIFNYKQKSISISLRQRVSNRKKKNTTSKSFPSSNTSLKSSASISKAKKTPLHENEREEWDLAILEVEELEDGDDGNAEAGHDHDEEDTHDPIDKQRSNYSVKL